MLGSAADGQRGIRYALDFITRDIERGVLEAIAVELGLDLVLVPPDPTVPLYTLLHPNRQGAVTLGGEVVGVLGEVHPAVVQAFRIRRARPCYLEVSNGAPDGADVRWDAEGRVTSRTNRP